VQPPVLAKRLIGRISGKGGVESPDPTKEETMAVGIRVKFDGVDADQFDKLEAAHNARNDVPAGLIFHASGPIEGGWGVLDFWESREQFDSFVGDRVGPAAAEVGITAVQDIHEFPVHEHLLGRN
jgi:hypothetical protein